MDNPNRQFVYVYYNGQGGERFLTAPNNEEAKKLVEKEVTNLTSYSSLHRTGLEVIATGSYFIRNLYQLLEEVKLDY